MLVGYIRVSSEGDRQSLDLQRDALLKAGIDARNIFEDKASGAKYKRPGLTNALGFLQVSLAVQKSPRVVGENFLPIRLPHN